MTDQSNSKLAALHDSALFALYGDVMAEIQRRGIPRTANNPIADYAEVLVARGLRLTMKGKSNTGHDAVDAEGQRYEVKSRRLARNSKVRMFGAIRRLEKKHFDFLAAVLFEDDFRVSRAVLVPHERVKQIAKFKEHTNAWIVLNDSRLWDAPDALDITEKLRAQQREAQINEKSRLS